MPQQLACDKERVVDHRFIKLSKIRSLQDLTRQGWLSVRSYAATLPG